MRTIRAEVELREVIRTPSEVVVSKIADHVNPLTRRFIDESPFLCIATSSLDGRCDVSPRGDAAGFVRILDRRTLLIPDRPGNRIADTLCNILENPHVGLVFLIPGAGDSFRVNGRARVVEDAELLAESAVDGRAPRLGIVVEIERAYTQCSKALIRSDLWNTANHVNRSRLPSSGEILRSVRGTTSTPSATTPSGRAGTRAEKGFTSPGQSTAATRSPTVIVPPPRMSARSPARCTSGRSSRRPDTRSRCAQGSASRRPTHSTVPTLNRRPARAFRSMPRVAMLRRASSHGSPSSSSTSASTSVS